MDPHRLAELRSLAYHAEIARRLPDAALVARALARLERWEASVSVAPAYAAAWRQALESGGAGLDEVLHADDAAAATLRSCTPFAGELPPRLRADIWRAVKRALDDSQNASASK